MNKSLLILFLLVVLKGFSQEEAYKIKDSIKENSISLSFLNEKLSTLESDINKQSKIKFTGFIQAQYDYYNFSPMPTPSNTFFIRRARLNASYKPSEEVKLVLQPDFSTHNFKLIDAYIALTDKWTKTFSIWAGQFSRLNYEIEKSSNSRDVLELPKLIKTIYPCEREIGIKLEAKPQKLPFKLQLAVFNGNFNGNDIKDAKDNDNGKDIMGRAIYALKFQKEKTDINFGISGYYGTLKTKDSKYITDSRNRLDSLTAGSTLKRYWGALEIQVNTNILGGLALKGEYIAGQNACLGTTTTTITQTGGTSSTYISEGISISTITDQNSTTKTVIIPNQLRYFSGYYVYFIKNIGKKNQLVIRYDNFDPNTKLSGEYSKSELYFNTITCAWQYFFDENVRLTFNYEMPTNETNSTVNKQILDNTISAQIQVKF